MSILVIRDGIPNTSDTLEAAESMLKKADQRLDSDRIEKAHQKAVAALESEGHDAANHALSAAETIQTYLKYEVHPEGRDAMDLLVDVLFQLGMAYQEV